MKLIDVVKKFLFLFGLSICLFVAVFIFTGIDEIWNNGKIWIYGLGMAGFLFTLGISSIIISISQKKQAPKFLLYLLLLFFILIIIGFFNS
ncbi:MAG: hypothetical protein U9O55_01420 [Patescibacteria group bacterium]|nr:hypothetical protein [Patescibacteria group bacterium]